MTQGHAPLLDDRFMYLLIMPACTSLPVPDRPFIEAKGGDNGLPRATMAEQNEHKSHQVGGRA
jgi:hypothetical protein